MSPGGAGRDDPQTAGETDVIEACQRWLELDFPDHPTTEPTSTVPGPTEGEL